MSYHYGITAYLEPNSEPIIGSSLCIDRDDTWNKQHATRAGKNGVCGKVENYHIHMSRF